MAVRKTSKNSSALKQTRKTPTTIPSKTPKSVYAHTVIMSDDSMAPTFVEGDVLTIDYEVEWEPGYYMLIRLDHLFLIRRFTVRGGDNLDYLPENPAYPEILEGLVDPWGVVSAVQRVDGKTEKFDLSTLCQ